MSAKYLTEITEGLLLPSILLSNNILNTASRKYYRSCSERANIKSLVKLFCNMRVLSDTAENWPKLSLTRTLLQRSREHLT